MLQLEETIDLVMSDLEHLAAPQRSVVDTVTSIDHADAYECSDENVTRVDLFVRY